MCEDICATRQPVLTLTALLLLFIYITWWLATFSDEPVSHLRSIIQRGSGLAQQSADQVELVGYGGRGRARVGLPLSRTRALDGLWFSTLR